MGFEQWHILTYLEAGAYVAIMLAVLGVPQMLSGYFDIRERRREREETRVEKERALQEQASSAERRHQEMMAMIAATIANGQEMMATTIANGQELVAAALTNSNRGGDDAIRSLQQEVANLRAEIAELRQERSNGASSGSA